MKHGQALSYIAGATLAKSSETNKLYGQFTKALLQRGWGRERNAECIKSCHCRLCECQHLADNAYAPAREGRETESWRGLGLGWQQQEEAALLTYDIQAECHRNLWLRIHLAFVDAAVTWLGIFHMQCPILGVGGPHHLPIEREKRESAGGWDRMPR